MINFGCNIQEAIAQYESVYDLRPIEFSVETSYNYYNDMTMTVIDDLLAKQQIGEDASMSNVKISIDPGAFAPVRAHKKDAAFDLCSMEAGVVKPHSYATFDTGVHFEIPYGYCGMIVSRSGLNSQYGITSTGLIDPSWTGSVGVILHNDGDEPFEVHPGDRIGQMIIFNVLMCNLELSGCLVDEDRGDNGFGSTGL